MIFLNVPHRVQSHYRVCQIQLVTECSSRKRASKASWQRLWIGYDVDTLIRLMETKKQALVLIKMAFFYYIHIGAGMGFFR